MKGHRAIAALACAVGIVCIAIAAAKKGSLPAAAPKLPAACGVDAAEAAPALAAELIRDGFRHLRAGRVGAAADAAAIAALFGCEEESGLLLSATEAKRSRWISSLRAEEGEAGAAGDARRAGRAASMRNRLGQREE